MTVSDVTSVPLPFPDVKSDLGLGGRGGGVLGRWKEAFLFIICSKRSYSSRGSQRLRIIQKYPSGRQELNGKSLQGWWRCWWSVGGHYLFSRSVGQSRKKIITPQEITFQNFPWRARYHSHSPICYGTYRFTIWAGKWNSNVQSEDLSGT